jgi:hypothetical protein
MRVPILAVFLALTGPVLAEPISGLDDPAFRQPFDRALQGDDPTALVDLHAAAEAGNQAAILALPMVSTWLRTTLPFAERKKLARVNGIPMAEAFAAADPVAALWAMGDTGTDMEALLSRAFALYAAEEADKATVLFMTWANQTGGYGPLPEGFFDQPTPPWAMAQVLLNRFNDTGFTPATEADALIVERLKAGDLAPWIALAAFEGFRHGEFPETISDRTIEILAAADAGGFEAVGGFGLANLSLPAIFSDDPILDAEFAARAVARTFRAEPEFQPLISLCETTCPTTKDACVIAFFAAFGHPYGRASMAQPLISLISTQDFFASPRGRLILLRSTNGALGEDPAASLALKAAREIDACLADAVLAAVP